MKIFLTTLFIAFIFNQIVFCFDKNNNNVKSGVKNHYQLLNDIRMQDDPEFFDVDFTPRKTKALVLSFLVPGSGQTMLISLQEKQKRLFFLSWFRVRDKLIWVMN